MSLVDLAFLLKSVSLFGKGSTIQINSKQLIFGGHLCNPCTYLYVFSMSFLFSCSSVYVAVVRGDVLSVFVGMHDILCQILCHVMTLFISVCIISPVAVKLETTQDTTHTYIQYIPLLLVPTNLLP